MRGLQLMLGLALSVPAAFAAGVPVASVISAQAFNLDGTVLANPGVTSYPVVINDELKTLDSDALLSFKDGSTISVAADSAVKVVGTEASPTVVLLTGKLDYQIAAGSKVQVVEAADNQDTGQGTDNDKDKKKKKRKPAAVPIDFSGPDTFLLALAVPIAFGGLGLAVAAILQPGSVSP